MAKSALFGSHPSRSLFDRLYAMIERWLMRSAEISNRNQDPPYFGM